MPFQALQHAYFNELRDNNVTINGRETVDLFNFGAVEVGKCEYLLPKLVPDWYDRDAKLKKLQEG